MAIAKRNPRVLIAGGGIGGLAAALALLKRGFDVDVYEQASELREVGAGVQLSANAIRVFHELGVHEALRALACEASGKEVRLWNSGQTWKLFDLGAVSVERYGFPYYTAYRPDLLAVLADGVHSRIRQALFGPDQAQFTGLVAWRGTIPMDRLPGHVRRLVGRAPMERWSAGRVSLFGDACHPTLPFLAQGAAMALEDGYILARALQAAGPDIEQGLARYEGARRERTAKVVHGSAEMARRFHNPALAESAGAQDYVSREWSEERVKSRYEWLFNHDVTAVAV
jgi:2-polyprenyl-6-methoxyphenol hydroxylase-like FAD-dependent oxidoreductase